MAVSKQVMEKISEKPLLVLNAGSSSLKFALFGGGPRPAGLYSGSIDRIGSSDSVFSLKGTDGRARERSNIPAPDHVTAFDHLLARIAKAAGAEDFASVGHRVVHGGPRYGEPRRIDGEMLAELRRIRSFDPEHLPSEVALMESVAARFPEMPQVACFDTAFHLSMPRVATLLPIPRRYESMGVRRYGFHGLSYTYLMEELRRVAGEGAARGRVILAHLGHGASMAAVRGGRPIDTSMAFTPAAGLVMSTRSGDVDPGLVSFMARSEGMTAPRFDRMVNHESGLLGISETSSDMRELLGRESSDIRAAEAVALFCYQAKKWIGAYAAALGGLDTLVFSGGIGENAAPIRERICEGMGFLGIELDASLNSVHAGVISTDEGTVAVRVIRTDEERVIAREVRRVLGPSREEGKP